MKWDMWYAHISGVVYKVGNTKDDLIEWLLGGYYSENYTWGSTKAAAIKSAKELFGEEWTPDVEGF